MKCAYRTADWCSVKAKTLTGSAECEKCKKFLKEAQEDSIKLKGEKK